MVYGNSDLNRLYFNSFESPEDIKSWKGDIILKQEAPDGGGMMSAYILGGCVYPHGALEFEASENMDLNLEVWARNLEIGGSVMLRNLSTQEHIMVAIKDHQWKKQISEEILTVNKGEKFNYP